jgi:hypothetical protein
MRFSKTTLSLTVAALLIASPAAFAQSSNPGSAGTSLTGTSNGQTGTPPSATSGSTMGRSDSMGSGSMGKTNSMAPADNQMDKGTTTSNGK